MTIFGTCLFSIQKLYKVLLKSMMQITLYDLMNFYSILLLNESAHILFVTNGINSSLYNVFTVHNFVLKKVCTELRKNWGTVPCSSNKFRTTAWFINGEFVEYSCPPIKFLMEIPLTGATFTLDDTIFLS